MGAMLTCQAMWPVRFGGRRQDLGFKSFIQLILVARELRGQSQTQVSKLAGPRICDPPQKSDCNIQWVLLEISSKKLQASPADWGPSKFELPHLRMKQKLVF